MPFFSSPRSATASPAVKRNPPIRPGRRQAFAAMLVAFGLLSTAAPSLALAQDPASSQAAASSTCVPAAIPFDAEDIQLTGRWSVDGGGMYYVRQIDDTVWWSGMSDAAQFSRPIGLDWSNVGKGTLKGDVLDLEYADVPRGSIFGSGTMSLRAEADGNGNLRLRRVSGDFGTTLFTPCEPTVQRLDGFARPLTFTIPFGSASGLWPGLTGLATMWLADVPDSGLAFWVVGPGWARHCAAAADWAPLAPGPDGFIASLRSRQDLVVGVTTDVTVGGLPAKSVEVTTAPGASGCDGSEWISLWKESGNEAMIQAGGTTRLVALDVEGATVVFEIYSQTPGTWEPQAQAILDTVRFDTAAALTDTIGQAADDGARIVKVDVLDERTRDVTIESPSVGYTKVRLLLPPGFADQPETRFPTLYLLDGSGDEYVVWARNTDVEELTADRDLLVAMTAASGGGVYSDWWQGGQGGQPAWETFHTQELPQLLERNWQAGEDRAIAGVSMGGFGTLSYAARHPGMYSAAASYSGVVDIMGSDFEMDPAIWGDKTAQADIWRAHNPLDLAGELEGTDLYISYGNGRPGPLDGGESMLDSLESSLATQNEALIARLSELGIPVTVHAYGDGTHVWPYWDRELRRSLPMLLDALGVPAP